MQKNHSIDTYTIKVTRVAYRCFFICGTPEKKLDNYVAYDEHQ